LALEPEAASIWCQQVDVGKQHAFNKTGSKYLVADLGGAYLTLLVLMNRKGVEFNNNFQTVFK